MKRGTRLKLRILGTRGIPAHHGGFETFAESFAQYMIERGHEVTVYCQTTDHHEVREDYWRGVNRVFLYGSESPAGTILFDLKSALHAVRRDGLILTLGYNTAVFSLLYSLTGRPSLMNMDGLEWMREKWSGPERLWLRLNELAGAHLSTHLVADHPEIGKHLESLVSPDKVTVIPYGADVSPTSHPGLIEKLGCKPYSYGLCIARPEPENSILQIVSAFSKQSRGYPLLVLGRFKPEENTYHRDVIEAASAEVIFPGAIYEKDLVRALRQFASFYVHGHQVGGTNPSLVEALAAGNAVIAHRNRFNLWTAGPQAKYFESEPELEELLRDLSAHPEQLQTMRAASSAMHKERFQTLAVNEAYETVLQRYVPSDKRVPGKTDGCSQDSWHPAESRDAVHPLLPR